MVSNYFERFGEYNPDDVVKSLTTTLRERKDAAGAVINDVTNKMGNAAVDTTNTMNALNTAIARQERLGTSANQSLLTSLRNLREELANPATDLDVTFDLLRQHRTAFRFNVQGDAMVFPNQAKAATNMVENAMSKDLRNAVAKTSVHQTQQNTLKQIPIMQMFIIRCLIKILLTSSTRQKVKPVLNL